MHFKSLSDSQKLLLSILLLILVGVGGALLLSREVPVQEESVGATPELRTAQGTFECLPHKDAEGPQTLECVSSITTESGEHYALDFSLMSSTAWMEFGVGDLVVVSGPFLPPSELESWVTAQYQIDGLISATSIERQ